MFLSIDYGAGMAVTSPTREFGESCWVAPPMLSNICVGILQLAEFRCFLVEVFFLVGRALSAFLWSGVAVLQSLHDCVFMWLGWIA